ncbi:hypothetical protein J2W51_002347 [Tardiphaga robiniae]|uniref:hypothetical protein n=1 Tax=Tardiphaga robiniae TaxID=943830 RepID=UPI0028600A25|nr:hypothetical protein [Tardiphaga robiniae]MDR6659777.1 hypothetical protein [Tardiphaga robiniae]
MTETTLEKHMAIVAKIAAKFVSDGLMTHDIDSRGSEKFLGEPIEGPVFDAALGWMINEGIIRVRNVSRAGSATFLVGAQLSSRGIAMVKTSTEGVSIETKMQKAETGADWSKIGDLIGGFTGGLLKSTSGG